MNFPSNTSTAEYCQIITSTVGGNEPFLAANGVNIPVAYSGGNGYSARIGNTWPNSGRNGGSNPTPDAESITYTYTVTAADAAFTYYYFPILNQGPAGHSEAAQPYFHIFMVTSTGDTVNCAGFNVDGTSAAIVGGFDSILADRSTLNAGKIYYKNWTPVYIPLTNYIGQTVSITFVTRSCNPAQQPPNCPDGQAGTHFAIAYIDGHCGPITMAVTAANTCTTNGYTLTAPAGASSYSWSGPGITTNTQQSITVTQSGHYIVTMNTYGANPCTFSMDTTITVAPFIPPSAGPDQTICQYSTATTQASRTGVWTIMSGNPAATTIANPSSANTVISGFTAIGRYRYIWTSIPNCIDTLSISVTAKPNAGPDQTTCQYSTATMAATGSGTWSALSTNPSATTITTPSSPTTSISGFTSASTYKFIWTANGCTDTANVIVKPKPNGGPDQSICQYATATMAGTGTGTWTIDPSGTWGLGTTISNPTSPTTTITGFIHPSGFALGYFYYWTLNGCSAVVEVYVAPKPNAGPDQTTCQYSTATMAATGTGIWTASAGNPAVVTFTNSSSPVTSVSGFTAVGTYNFIWTSGGCSDTANVIVKPTPNGGPEQYICQYTTATMAGTGTGTWTIDPTHLLPTTISNPTSPTTIITGFIYPSSFGLRYFYYWTLNGCSAVVEVHVAPKPNAGPDQTTCQYSTATMAAVGTGTWTAAAGNPAVVTFTTPSSPTSSVSGFTAAGTYTLLWSLNGCSDTALVNVIPKPNAGPNQNICQFYSVTMAAIGTGTWTALSTNPTATVITTPASPGTVISGFSVAGAYSYVWTVNGCTDTVLINANTKPNAGPDESTCQYSTATMAATGTGVWLAAAGNPSVVSFTTPSSPTSSVSGFASAGTYTLFWSNNGCNDTALVNVIAKPNAGPDQTICQYTTATMVATDTGTWTALSANPAATVITTPTSPATVISGFSVSGTYSYIWTANGCTDTANVIVTPKPNAGPDQIACQYSTTTMAATGTGTWTALSTNPAMTVITIPTSPTTVVHGFSVPGVYSYVWTKNGCTDTANVTVTVKPNAGPDQSICQYTTATMAAIGMGTWTALATNPAATVIATPASPASSISGFSVAGTYGYIWTANGCTDTANVIVIPKPNAGPDLTTCQYSTATMAAMGAGTWTALSTNPVTTIITTPASPATVISGYSVPGVYGYVWTVNGCTDTINVTVTVKPNAGADVSFCMPGSTTINAVSGPGIWTAQSSNPGSSTIVSPTSTSTVISSTSIGGYYHYIWTVNGCTDTMMVTAYPTMPSGPNQTICQYSSIVTAAFGHGTWIPLSTNPSPAIIADTTADTTTISGFTIPGSYGFIWSVSPCTDTMYVTVVAKPNAGTDQTICQYSFTTLAAMGTGTWTADAGNPAVVNFVNATLATTQVSGFTVSGTYTIYWSLNGCSDTVLINVTPKPNAGTDQTICQYSSTVLAATGTGIWTADAGNPAVVVIANTASSASSVSGFAVGGTYTLYWSLSGCSDTVLIHVTPKPNAGTDQTICQYSTTALAATGTGTWTAALSNPAVVVFTNPADSISPVSGFTNSGIYTLYWSLNGCSDTVLIHVTPKPNAGTDQTICQYSTTALSATGTGTWTADASNPNVVVFANPTSPTTQVSGFTAPGTDTLYWSLNGCSDTVLIHVTAKPNAGPGQNICQFTTATMAAIGTGTWTLLPSNPSAASITSPIAANTTITGLDSVGTYSFIWTVNGCADTVKVAVSPQPTLSLRDTAICLNQSATLVPVVSPPGGTYLWSTMATTPTITVSPALTTGYTLTYTLGICATIITDTVIINPLPIATVSTIASVCTANDGMAIAHPGAGTPGYTYSWSAPGGTGDSLSDLSPGTYVVTVTDINQCTVTASGNVAHQTPAIIVNEVSQHNLKCFNDGTGDIYISTTDTARNAGTYTMSYIWNGGPVTTQYLTNVQAGGYSVTITDQFGCTGTASYTLTQPLAITASTAVTNPHCYGYSDGTAGVSPSGGSGAYHYVWNTTPAQNTRQATNLAAGIYTVSVTDDNACIASFTDTLINPLAITFRTPLITNASCLNVSNGKVQAIPQNGIGSYTFQWSNGETGNPDTALAMGTYTVTATDANGCFASSTDTVIPLTQVVVSIASTNVSCFGYTDGAATATASGATPLYLYIWNTAAKTTTISNLAAGTYAVTATDNYGCTAANSVAIIQPTLLTETLTPVRTHCPFSLDGSIRDSAGGGTSPYAYTLKDTTNTIIQTNTTGSFTGLGYGLYTVVTIDQHNCRATDTVTVPQAPFNYYTDTAISTSCYGSRYTDGIIHLQGYTIPNGPFQYSIDGGASQYTPDFFHLSAGIHTITIQDNYGCDTTFTIIVPEPLPATLQILPGDSTIAPGASLQLSTIFSPYSTNSIKTYSWSPGDGLNCIDCPSPVVSPYADQTLYTLVVTYNQGCIDTAYIQIDTKGTPPVYIPNAFTPNGNGVNDVWYVFGTGIKDIKVTVFNRWGEKVFESYDQFIGWDGTYKGQPQPPGVYVYEVNLVYLNGETKLKKGGLTLIR